MERGKRIGVNPVDDAICYHPYGECVLTEEQKKFWKDLIANPEKFKEALDRLSKVDKEDIL